MKLSVGRASQSWKASWRPWNADSDKVFVVAALVLAAISRIQITTNNTLSRRDFLKIARRFNAGNELANKRVPKGRLIRLVC